MKNCIKIEEYFNDANAIGFYPEGLDKPASLFVKIDTKKNESLKYMTADSLIRRVLSRLFKEHNVKAADVMVLEETKAGNKYGIVWLSSGYPGDFVWNTVSEDRFREVLHNGVLDYEP